MRSRRILRSIKRPAQIADAAKVDRHALIPLVRRHARALRRLAVAGTVGAVIVSASPASAPGAGSTIVVGMNLGSAIVTTNGCTQAPGRTLNVVPGTPATSATGAGVCHYEFTATNNTAQLRLGQRDGEGSAMTSFDSDIDTMVAPATSLTYVDTVPATVGVLYGYAENDLQHSIDGGATWTNETTGVGWARGVSVSSSTNAWAAGWSGTLLKRTGAAPPTVGSWVSPTAIAGASEYRDVEAFSALGAFVTTEDGMYRTLNYGTSWVPMNSGMPMTGGEQVDAANASVAWTANSANDFYVTVNGGNSWTQVPGIPGCSGGCALTELLAIDANTVYIVTADGVTYTTDAGVNWNNATLHPWSYKVLTGIDGTAGNIFVSGQGGMISRSTDGGANFFQVKQPTANRFEDVVMEGTRFYAAGQGSAVVMTTDSVNWSLMRAGTNDLQSVDAPTLGTTAWAVGSRGTIRKTIDAAVTWSPQAAPTTEDLWSVSAVSTAIAWAVGDNGTLLRTIDGGANWTAQSSPTTVDLYSVSAPSEYWIWIAGENGAAYQSADGGTTWRTIGPDAETINSISAVDGEVAYIGQQGGTIQRTADGGTTWIVQTENIWDVVRSVYAVDANVAFAVGRWNDVQRTVDGGATPWTDIGGQGNGPALAVSGADADHAFLGADSGGSYQGGSWTFPWSTSEVTGVKAVDAHRAYFVGVGGGIYRSKPGTSIAQYGGANNFSSVGNINLFGVCLQAVGVGTTPAWTVDANGTCTPFDTDPWNAIPATATQIASTGTIGATGTVDVVWGSRMRTDQAVGLYSASVVFETLAP